MYTFEDYLKWRGDLTFDQVPFNEADAGLLARFAYEPMEGVVSGEYKEQKRLKDVCAQLLEKYDLSDYVLDRTMDPKFIGLMGECRRYQDILLSGYTNVISTDTQVQFSAVLYQLYPGGDYYLTYRGTDITLIAWKEDFNMGFEFPVPGQVMALEYLEKAVSQFPDGTFMIGGHSKGGNFSIYSASFCKSEYRKAIKKIYNFDGPGFTKSLAETTEGYKEISSRIITFVPRFSVVGMILEHEEDYQVVDTNVSGIMQHEILYWGFEPTTFDYVEDLDKSSKFLDETMCDWLKTLSKEEREQFVESLYMIVESSNASTVHEFADNRKEAVAKMLSYYSKLDAETKNKLKATFRKFMECAKMNLKKEERATLPIAKPVANIVAKLNKNSGAAGAGSIV